MRQKSKFYAIVFGADPNADEPNPPVEGTLYPFETQSELNAWMNQVGVTPHESLHAAKMNFLQLPNPDNRAVMIIRGNIKSSETKIQVV